MPSPGLFLHAGLLVASDSDRARIPPTWTSVAVPMTTLLTCSKFLAGAGSGLNADFTSGSDPWSRRAMAFLKAYWLARNQCETAQAPGSISPMGTMLDRGRDDGFRGHR
jgi:hypothetical protein